MSLTVFAAFVATCVLLAVTPGPNMSLIIANTTAHGLRAGLITLIGSGTGLAILVATAAAGMTSVMVFMSEWFDVVRWLGALYLVWLGSRQLWLWWKARGGPVKVRPGSRRGWYFQGLAVSLSNPKVLLFLGAFLPQFVDPAYDPVPQLMILSVVFVVVLVSVDAAYTLALGKARARFTDRHFRVLDGVAGGLLLAAGAFLAAARRP